MLQSEFLAKVAQSPCIVLHCLILTRMVLSFETIKKDGIYLLFYCFNVICHLFNCFRHLSYFLDYIEKVVSLTFLFLLQFRSCQLVWSGMCCFIASKLAFISLVMSHDSNALLLTALVMLSLFSLTLTVQQKFSCHRFPSWIGILALLC